MIKYNLKCKNKHEFESWFLDSKEFDRLHKKKLIECVFCKTTSIKKSIMSPRIVNNNEVPFPTQEIKKIKKDLIKLRRFVEKNFENVGDNLPNEVRKIHYSKNKNKNIYGTASLKQTEELREEGIDLTTSPWIQDNEN